MMKQTFNQSGKILEVSLSSSRPVKDLLDMAKTFIKKTDTEGLYDIDTVLTGLLVDYIRKGTRDQFENLMDDLKAFLDSKKGDLLKLLLEGERYYHRWEYLVDFSRIALENYDPDLISRFIDSRKHGSRMLTLVNESPRGIRPKELAKGLEISDQQLAKLLREFEAQDLVVREKENKATLVHLGFLGRVYISEIMEKRDPERVEPVKPAQPYPFPFGDVPAADLYNNIQAIRRRTANG
jgi:CTP-dependent riboflavin kinase